MENTMNTSTAPPTRRIRVTVEDGTPTTLKAAIAQLNGATAATKKNENAEVAAAQASLAPTVRRAKELLREFNAVAEQHGAALNELREADWVAVARYGVPSPTISRATNLLDEAHLALHRVPATLRVIEDRVESLRPGDLELRVVPQHKPYESEGLRPVGVTRIKADVQAQEGAAARIVEIVAEVESHLVNIMTTVERAGGKLGRAIQITEPHDVSAPMPPSGYAKADTAFNIFEQEVR